MGEEGWIEKRNGRAKIVGAGGIKERFLEGAVEMDRASWVVEAAQHGLGDEGTDLFFLEVGA